MANFYKIQNNFFLIFYFILIFIPFDLVFFIFGKNLIEIVLVESHFIYKYNLIPLSVLFRLEV